MNRILYYGGRSADDLAAFKEARASCNGLARSARMFDGPELMVETVTGKVAVDAVLFFNCSPDQEESISRSWEAAAKGAGSKAPEFGNMDDPRAAQPEPEPAKPKAKRKVTKKAPAKG